MAMIAVTASAVGSALNMGVEYALKGDAYGWEEFGVDMATAVVDAIASYLTAGMGARLLKGLPFLKNLATKGGTALWLAKALAEGVENTLGICRAPSWECFSIPPPTTVTLSSTC